MLEWVQPSRSLTVGGVCLLLLVSALGAIWMPARRAAALDPLSALHYE
jgi:ABC-type lipoprotein release transport system permease subunit